MSDEKLVMGKIKSSGYEAAKVVRAFAEKLNEMPGENRAVLYRDGKEIELHFACAECGRVFIWTGEFVKSALHTEMYCEECSGKNFQVRAFFK